MNRRVFVLGLALLCGCSTHPVTGRNQIVLLPVVQAAHADAGFELFNTAREFTSAAPCAHDCGDARRLAAFAARVAAIGTRLEDSARSTYPELFVRVQGVRIEVNGALGVGTASSAGGRIALGAGLAALEPTDTVIAFLIAREMAHVIARHAEEDSGAAIVFSALGLLLPGVSAIARFFATTLGSGALKASWALDQQREADEIAVVLLERAGLHAARVAHDLDQGVKRAQVPDDEWGTRYVGSTQRVALIAASQPR